MKKAVLLAAIFGIFSLSSCCRIIDCCFEDPCSLPSSCVPCKNVSNSCGSYKPSCSKLVGEIKDNNKAHRLKAVHLLTVAADSKGRPYLFT